MSVWLPFYIVLCIAATRIVLYFDAISFYNHKTEINAYLLTYLVHCIV